MLCNRGTYVGYELSEKSKNDLEKFCFDNKIPNPVKRFSYHVTLIYSRKELKSFQPSKSLAYPLLTYPTEFELWEQRNGRFCLVLPLHSESLQQEHEFIKDWHGATHDFDDFTPHITLSYNCHIFDTECLEFGEPIELSYQYKERLKL